MNESVTLSFNDYLFEIGNLFFNVNENDMKYQVNDLDYESEDENGFNGVMLKLEHGTDELKSGFINHLLLLFQYIHGVFLKKKVQKACLLENYEKSKIYRSDMNQIIHNKVRSRLLSVINEDIDKWQLSPEIKLENHNTLNPYKGNIIKTLGKLAILSNRAIPLYRKLMKLDDIKSLHKPIKNPIKER